MSLLLKTRPLVVQPELAVRIGLAEAMLIQKIQYWLTETESGMEHDGRWWIYNTLDAWHHQLPFYSESTIKRAFASLKKQGLICIEQINKQQHDRTNYYSINYDHPLLSDEVTVTPSGKKETSSRTGQSDAIDQVKLTPSNRSKWPHPSGQNEPIHQDKMASSIRSEWSDLSQSTTQSTTQITTQKISCPDAAQPDAPSDENFIDSHPEAVVFSPKKRQWGSQEDLACARWIWERITRLYEQAAETDGEVVRPREPNWTAWANEVRLMCNQDGRSHRQICELFSRVNRDPFWCRNVLSPGKLREKWDELALKLSTGLSPVRDTSLDDNWNTPEGWENTL